MIKLDIGAGGKSSDDSFISVDRYVDSADIRADMWDLPYKDGEVDVIFASHCLEHISKYKVLPTLKEWARVLKIGGHLQIIVPDMVWACKWWLEYPYVNTGMDHIYGNQRHDGEYHKTGFTPGIMRFYLEEVPTLVIHNVSYYGMTIEDIYKPHTDGDRIDQRVINFEILRVEHGQ